MALRFVPAIWILLALAAGTVSAGPPLERFITRDGSRLMDGGDEFRFISFNIPNLHYVEDDLAFDQPNPWRLPDEFEIADGLRAVDQMGGRVVRIYTLSVRRQDDDASIPRHVLGPGQFNEEAFRALDKVLEQANRTGIRVIVPFVDQWSWWGGIAEYARFRGLKGTDFWTDPQLIADFKQTIRFVLERKNTYTGTLYRDDKAILAWETGNELSNPPAWSREIAAYIKSVDPNHLVIDGYHAGSRGLAPESIDDPNIDVITTHHYPGFPVPLAAAVEQARAQIAGRKPYFVGEVGFMPTATIADLLDLGHGQGDLGRARLEPARAQPRRRLLLALGACGRRRVQGVPLARLRDRRPLRRGGAPRAHAREGLRDSGKGASPAARSRAAPAAAHRGPTRSRGRDRLAPRRTTSSARARPADRGRSSARAWTTRRFRTRRSSPTRGRCPGSSTSTGCGRRTTPARRSPRTWPGRCAWTA